MEHNEPNDTFEQGQSSGAPGGARTGGPGGFGGAADAASGTSAAGAAPRGDLAPEGGASQGDGNQRSGMQGAAGGMGQSQSQSYQRSQQQAKERLGQARDRAVDIKHSVESSLAERLEQGAQRLRARRNAARNAVAGSGSIGAQGIHTTGPGSPAYVGPEGTSATGTAGVAQQRTDKLETSVARGMEKTADWLRDGDLRTSVEQEVRKNPARSVAIALGLGYLLGKVFKNR